MSVDEVHAQQEEGRRCPHGRQRIEGFLRAASVRSVIEGERNHGAISGATQVDVAENPVHGNDQPGEAAARQREKHDGASAKSSQLRLFGTHAGAN